MGTNHHAYTDRSKAVERRHAPTVDVELAEDDEDRVLLTACTEDSERGGLALTPVSGTRACGRLGATLKRRTRRGVCVESRGHSGSGSVSEDGSRRSNLMNTNV